MTGQLSFVRGEMADWSEGRGPVPTGGPVLLHVLDQHLRAGVRALVLGVHDDAVLELVVARSSSVTLVLRSRPDAVAAAARLNPHGVDVICGDAGEISLDEPAEALVAIDGLERALSAEVEYTPWGDRWARISTQLTADAQVFLGAANPLGLSQIGGSWPQLADTDADWRSVVPSDPTVPGTSGQLADMVPGAAVWSLFPDPRDPGVAVPVGHATPGSGAAALARVHAGPQHGHLDGPTTLQSAIEAGRADELAGGWLAVTHVTDPALVSTVGAVVPDGRVLEDAFLGSMAAREIGHVRELAAQVVAQMRALDAETLKALAHAGPAEVLLTSGGELVPLVPGEVTARTTRDPDDIAARWFETLATRLSRLGWKHPFPEVAGRREVALLLADAAGVDRATMEAAFVLAAAAEDQADAIPPEVARLERENAALRAKIVWFEAAVRHRETMLAELRQKRADPRPRLQRELEQARADLAALRGSRAYRLGRAMMAPARVVRDRLR